MRLAKLANRTLFVLSVVVTGSVAGAFVWALLFVMNLGISFVWDSVGARFGIYFPLAACLVGGLVVGLFAKRFGPYPEDLDTVMAKVKRDGRYDYDKLGVMSIAALLPLFFGGSIGPEAGLTGAVAGICTWVGDRMKRFGADFQQLTSVGTMAALSAIFTAPLFGFAAPLYGDGKDGGENGDGPKGAATITLPKNSKIVVYFCAIAGALAAFFGGTALDGLAAGLFALVLCVLQIVLPPLCKNKVLFNFLSAFAVGALICLACRLVPALHSDKVIIGDIMLLIPGLAFTNAVKDIFIGDTISGVMRLIETILWAAALALGFALAGWLLGV